jgi:hypothetical protein
LTRQESIVTSEDGIIQSIVFFVILKPIESSICMGYNRVKIQFLALKKGRVLINM